MQFIPLDKKNFMSSFTAKDFLFVSGGNSATTEIFDLSGEERVCTSHAPYPNDAKGHALATYNGLAVGCGGFSGGTAVASCFLYDKFTNSWLDFGASLIIPMASDSMVSFQLSETDFIIGDGQLGTTQRYRESTGSFEQGPDLGYAALSSCYIMENSGSFVQSGGYSNGYLDYSRITNMFYGKLEKLW